MSFPPTNPSPPQPEEPQRPPPALSRVEGEPLPPPSPMPATTPLYAIDDGAEPWLTPAEGPRPSHAWRRTRHLAWELLQTLVLAALIFLAVRAMAQNFRVEGSSMEPGLHDGQYLLVNKAIYFKINLDRLGKYLPFV